MQLNVRLTDDAPLPRHAKPGDAGIDLTSRATTTLWPGDTKLVSTGVSMEIPEGYVGLVFPRSGLASKQGINLQNCVGVIDSGYRGEIHAPLHNNNAFFDKPIKIKRGERVCQLVLVQCETIECVEVDELDETVRGADGFGSSGRMAEE